MTNLSDTLAALSEAATQGEWYADCEQVCVSNGPQVCETLNDHQYEDAAFIATLVNAYRTGQLVPVPSVERVESQQKPCKNCGFLPDSAD